MTRLALALLLLGAGLRTAAFASERSLWIDEAMVALNVVERSPARLFEPLDRNQGAPVGFLLATKASVAVFGPTERALRLPAFFASLVGLIAFGSAARQLLPHPAVLLAFALFAVSPHFVSYAAECKQYSGDAAFAAVLLAIAAGPLTRRRRFAFGIVGALSVWCSHPALFVLAGLGLALFGQALRNRDRARIFALVALGAAWLASFAAVYFVNLRHLGHNDYLIRYWAGHFAPPPTSRSGLIWYVDHALAFVNEPAGMTGENRIVQALMVVVVLFGSIAMYRRRIGQTSLPSPLSEAERGDKNRVVFLPLSVSERGPGGEVPRTGILVASLLTVAIALFASAVQLYPFAGRLLLFLVPMACLFWGAGSHWLGARLGRWGIALAWLIVVWPLIKSIEQIDGPKRAEEIQPVLRYVRANWADGDRLYIYGGSGDAGAGPAFDFYSPRYDFPSDRIIRGGIHREEPSKYRDEILELPAGRTWVLITHRHRDEELVIVSAFAERAYGHIAYGQPGASLWIFQLRPHSPP